MAGLRQLRHSCDITMKLRATISIEFDAEDAVQARSKKREIEARVGDLAACYDDLRLVFTERRERRRPRAPAPSAIYPAVVERTL